MKRPNLARRLITHSWSALRTVCLCGVLGATSLSAVVTEELAQGTAAHFTGQGNVAYVQEQFDTAIELYNRALGVDKNYYYALYNLALTHQQIALFSRDPEERRRHFEESRRQYAGALQQRPDSAEALCNLGIIAYHLHEYGIAAGHFSRAADQATKADDIAEYAYNLGTAEEKRQQWRSAEEAYLRCIKLDEAHFGAHFNLGTLYLHHLDQPGRADEHLQNARSLDAKRPEPVLNLAVLSEQRDRLLEAEQLYSEAVRVAASSVPHLEVDMRWHRAQFYWRADLPDPERRTKILMKQDLLTILEQHPDYAEANGLLGRYYESIAEYGQAVHYLEREVREDNFDPESEVDLMSHFLLATIYSEHLDNTAKALEHVRAYYELRPDQSGNILRRNALRLRASQEQAEP